MRRRVRHARPPAARVVLTAGADLLTLDVDDEGTGSGQPHDSGRGLRGMADRAQLYGGILDAGPTTGGGFRVHAEFPLPEARA